MIINHKGFINDYHMKYPNVFFMTLNQGKILPRKVISWKTTYRPLNCQRDTHLCVCEI